MQLFCVRLLWFVCVWGVGKGEIWPTSSSPTAKREGDSGRRGKEQAEEEEEEEDGEGEEEDKGGSEGSFSGRRWVR